MLMNFLSHLIIPGILLGILCFVVSFFIPVITYKLPLQLAGLVLVIFFVFHGGRQMEATKYEKQRLIDQAAYSVLQEKSAKGDTKIVIEYVDRIKTIERIKEVKTNVYVTKEADSSCVISDTTSRNITRLLNASSKGIVPDTPISIDDSTRSTNPATRK